MLIHGGNARSADQNRQRTAASEESTVTAPIDRVGMDTALPSEMKG